jgi:tetratricopeptide (TPR) repeat protein
MTTRPHPSEFLCANSDPILPARCAQIFQDFLTGRGDPSGELDQVLDQNPELVFGHCLRAAIVVRGDYIGARSRLLRSIVAIEAICPHVDDWGRRHASAAHAWLDGNQALADERYGAIIIDFPRDLVALAVANALDFRLGQRRMLRDRVAQILPEWHENLPGYASVLAMYAFGLEENGQYGRAEKVARRALLLDPHHPGAIHVIAHVMEMQGRGQEGLEFLAITEPAWRKTSYSVHLAWHRALFHLDDDDALSALAVYDHCIAESRAMSELADGSALLWRLQLGNVQLGDRWQRLADRWEMQALAGARAFYFAHAMMAFAAAHRAAAVARVLNLLQQTKFEGLALSLEDQLMVRLCEALLIFAQGDYVGCVERLGRVRHIADRCGGSLAQCDLIQLTIVEAALRANKANLARSLVAERMAHKPSSRLNRRLHQRLGDKPQDGVSRHTRVKPLPLICTNSGPSNE